jgi:hypothetical protein
MKFPSLTRIHQHKRFHYEPRYYDPVKEDIKNRTERIRSEIVAETHRGYREHIREAFNRRDRENKKTSFMQLLLITIMMGTVVGWLYYGNVAFYAFLVLFPLYIILRTSKLFRS